MFKLVLTGISIGYRSVVMMSADSTELRHQYRETGYHGWGKTGEWENKNRKKMCVRNANLQS